jgi:hypothetical protein
MSMHKKLLGFRLAMAASFLAPSFFLSFSSEEVAPFCPVLKCSCLLVIAAAAAVSLTILLLLQQQQNCGQTDRPTDRLFFVHAYPLPLITAAAAPCACCMLVVREEEARSTHAEIYLHKTFILHNERTNERANDERCMNNVVTRPRMLRVEAAHARTTLA